MGRLLLCLILLSGVAASLAPSGPMPVSGVVGTPVSSCQTISEPGDYFLSQDISLATTFGNVCIEIQASNVVFDCIGHAIRGSGAAWSGTQALFVSGSSSTVKNCVLSDMGRGVATGGNNNLVLNNTIYNMWEGINAAGDYNTYENNTVYNNRVMEGRAFTIWWGPSTPTGHTVRGNRFTDSNYGIDLGYCDGPYPFPCITGHLFYNNYVAGNTVNARDSAGYNSWNVTKTPGTNILGGPFLGGNFWNDYGGVDTDGDALGDTMLPYTSGANIANGGDSAPLKECASPPAGLVSWWPGDGDASDIVGDNPGTLINGATFANGKVGQAFSFDGIDDYVSVANSPSLQNANTVVTFDAWIYTTSLTYQMITVKRASVFDGQWYFRLEPNGENLNFRFELYDGTAFRDVIGTQLASLNQWNHVAFVYDKNAQTVTIYLNGVGEQFNFPYVMPASTASVSIGSHLPSYYEQFFDGLIDEVRLFNRALPPSEIKAIYDAGSLGNCKAPFDFSMSNSFDIAVFRGMSGSNIIMATLLSGTPQPVALACTSGLPLEASCTFGTNPVFPTYSASLVIATTTSTPVGLFTITVTGSGGGLTRTTQFVLVVASGGGGGGRYQT